MAYLFSQHKVKLKTGIELMGVAVQQFINCVALVFITSRCQDVRGSSSIFFIKPLLLWHDKHARECVGGRNGHSPVQLAKHKRAICRSEFYCTHAHTHS